MYHPEKAKPMVLPISFASIWQKIKLSGSPEEVSYPRILYSPKSAASTRRKRHTADTANKVRNSLFSFSLSKSGSEEAAAIINPPPVDAGLRPANDAVRHIILINPTGETPTLVATLPTVGIIVGQTTPMAELNHDMIHAVKPRIAVAVLGVITDASALESNSTPPTEITMFISMPKPVTISKVDHEIA